MGVHNHSSGPEKILDAIVIKHCHMHVDAHDGKIRVTGGDANLGQRAAARERAADERVLPVMGGERVVASKAQDLAGG